MAKTQRSVRTMKIELYRFSAERRKKWRDLAESVQRATNRLWQIWLVHHATHGSMEQLRSDLQAYRQWEADGRIGTKPQWQVNALPRELTTSSLPTSFYRILSAEFPDLNARTRGLLTNRWQSLLRSRKATRGSLPGWAAILLAHESVPSFTHPLPIPFDVQNSKLLRDDAGYHVEMRIERLPDSGKSVVETADLMLRKRKAARLRVTLDRILDGTYAWKGCNLVFSRGKWFVAVCYAMPKAHHETLDRNKTLYVWPGRDRPFAAMVAGGDGWHTGGSGDHVTRTRRLIATERAQRQEHYHWSGSAQRGRGRKRANAVWTKLSSRWRDFVGRLNQQCSTNVVQSAVRNRCGRVVYMRPARERRVRRFLGCDETGRRMTWSFFRFGTMLQWKCEHEGIVCEIRKVTTGTNRGDKKHAA